MKKQTVKKSKKISQFQKNKQRDLDIDNLLNHISAGNLETLIEKVGWILNHFPQTRDSDISCQIKFWETFEPGIINNGIIKVSDLYKYTRLTSVVRARAKIQNEYKLFLASEEVRKHRGKLEEEYESWAVSEQPDCAQYSLYIDESGKTSDYLILGSLWILDSISTMTLFNKILELKERYNYNKEFHFKTISSSTQAIYKELIDLLYTYSSALCFKFTYISKDGVNIQNALNIMFYHLIIDGIKHEYSTGRAPLPRSLLVIKDLESKGADTLFLKELKIKIQEAAKSVFDNKLFVNEFRPIDSKENYYLQIADIFVASINRKINEDSSQNTAKDIIANYFFEKFGLSLEAGHVSTLTDISSSIEMS